MVYCAYTSPWSVHCQLVDYSLDCTHEVFDGCHLRGDGCDGHFEVSVFCC